MKSLWRGINSQNICGELFCSKYLKNKDFDFWARQGEIGKKGRSQIWNSFRKVKNILLQNLKWVFGTCNSIIIGKYCIIGAREEAPGTVDLIMYLNRRGFFVLNQLIWEWKGNIPISCDFSQLNLANQYKHDRLQLIKTLKEGGISYDKKGDILTWGGKKKILGEVEVADYYLKISMKEFHNGEYFWFFRFWKVNIPIKIVTFLLLFG